MIRYYIIEFGDVYQHEINGCYVEKSIKSWPKEVQ